MDKENRLALDQPDYHILVAEDHPKNRALLSKLLQLAGLDLRCTRRSTGKKQLNNMKNDNRVSSGWICGCR